MSVSCAYSSPDASLPGEARTEAHAVLILLDLGDAAVLEGPPDHVRVAAGALDVLGLVDGGPELVEVGQFNKVPHVGERGLDDGALHHLVGGRDTLGAGSSHVQCRWLVFGVECVGL